VFDRPAERPPSVKSRRGTAGCLALAGLSLLAAGAARAAAPQPVRPISSEVYSGRWYEIARTPNTMQKDCAGATIDFQGLSDGAFSVVDTCHKGDPRGPAKIVKVKAKVIRPPDYTRFRMSFLGGMIHQEYWIIDHADDNSWAVMGTPGGNYVWLLSRRPVLAPPVLSSAMNRIAALGYTPSRLIFPAQIGGQTGGLTANTP